MNKRGRETVLTAYAILVTIALVGGFFAYYSSSSAPAAAAVVDSGDSLLSINSFDAVFDPDGMTSFKLAASAGENLKLGLAGDFVLAFETSGRVIEYQGSVFFDGAFGEIKSMKIIRADGVFEAENVKGTVVVTNAVGNTATVLMKADFERPQVQKIFEPPSKILVTFDFRTYDKTYASKVLPIRYAEKPNPFPYYLNSFGIIEINA